ncbi:SdrD B-like domain-containing protein [Antribacter gilvus]|uniref:SdrD B-like domain-containing protein n=1 Tax=Antribacter gilvus TaxID=2304675 RepID=UPI000F7B188D|nr:SdrD B-like domain-containing protein [Antribacter gilvus]
MATAPSARAAEQNGYVFNDPWTLVTPGTAATSFTDPAYRASATNTARTTIPAGLGSVTVTAQFAPDATRTAGTTFLTNGTNQSAYGGTPAMFHGAPTPANVPALGLLTHASGGCGGALGTAAHQNFASSCDVGLLTVTFSRPVTDMVLDISGLGGYATAQYEQAPNFYARGSFNSTIWSIVGGGVTFANPTAGRTNLAVSPTSMQVTNRNTSPFCNTRNKSNDGTPSESPDTDFAGCGSVILSGTTTAVTFRIQSLVSPFSLYPTATYGTGSALFQNNGTVNADGINGANVTYSEPILLPSRTATLVNADLQRISFRLPALGVLGDRVWQDVDGDGLQDAGEPGVAGVTVTLTDADGNPVLGATGQPIATTTTAAGAYTFTGLPFGTYRVRFSGLPAGFSFVAPDAGDDTLDSDADPATGLTPATTLSSAAPQDLTLDAGIAQLGSIGDRVWRDDDGDGVQDAGEPGVGGVTVVLYDAAGAEVARTTTAADGTYLFASLPLGDYAVEFTALPAGTVLSPQDAGADDAVDSDADPATGRTGTVTLTPAARDVLTVDAGVVPLGGIGDTVWSDVDRDGLQDAGEPGVAGVTVVLYDGAGAEVARTTTDADGAYWFGDLPLGGYTVEFTDLPTASTLTALDAGDDALDSDADPATGRTATVTLTGDAPVVQTVDAGILAPLGSVGDTVWSDVDRDGVQDAGEPGVAGVTVVLYDAAGAEVARTTTDADGGYLFSGLAMGDYTVEFTGLPTGTTLSPQDTGTDDGLDSDADPATGRTGTVSLTPETPDVLTVDAGVLPPLGSIGDLVWRDADADGVQDAGEPGVAAVTVVLYDAAGAEVARTTSDANGAYLFAGLPMGDYTVELTGLPAGLALTGQDLGGDDALDSDADPATGRTGTVRLTPEQPDVLTVDAGLVPLGSIGDLVWRDQDGDGLQDEGEPGLPGVTVVLYDAAGAEVARTTTDADGGYLFEDLPVGDYAVEFTGLAADQRLTALDAGDDALDSDADPLTGRTGTIAVVDGALDVRTVDAGVVQLGSVGDTVWLDEDRDGVQDAGEPGVPAVTVVLRDAAGGEVARTTTDENGAYLFEGLPLGDYSVLFENLPTAATLTTQGSGTDPALDSDADPATGSTGTVSLTNEVPDRTDIDAGVLPPLGSIGDTLWSDLDGDGLQGAGEPGLAGVTVVLYDADSVEVGRTTTAADGTYLFENLPMGDYTVAVEGLGDDQILSPQDAGDDALDSDADPATGRTGTITLVAGARDVRTVDIGVVQLGSVGDTVWRDLDDDGVQDAGEPGVAAVTVVLHDATGAEVARTTTAADGTYLFAGLSLGDYSVTFTAPEGLGLSPQDVGDDMLDSDADPLTGSTGPVTLTVDAPHTRDLDAGLVRLGSIGDVVWDDVDGDGVQDDGEPGLAGVTVVLFDASGAEVARTTTGADGTYVFGGLPMADYSVGFEGLPVGTGFSPANSGGDDALDSDADPVTGRTATITLTNDVPDRTDVDAGVQVLGSIGDRVWRDLDDDGVQDDGEPGAAGVTVVLRASDGAELARTTTAADGSYLFGDLVLGDYVVGFEAPDGFGLSPQDMGDDALDSDADPVTGRTAVVTLIRDLPDVLTVDAGLVRLGSIGDRVWQDLDGDGVQDPGEPGLAGVTVVLYDATGAEVARTATAADGSYLFAGLPMGDYTVGLEGLPADTTLSPVSQGGDPALDSDVDPATGRTAAVALTDEAPDRTDVDAGVQPTGSIGDTVWRDLDDDGVQDAGEPGVGGVTVVLYDTTGAEVARTTAADDGTYLFDGLVLGDYTVGFEGLAGDLAWTGSDVGDDALDSDADPATGRTATITLTTDVPDRTDVDAGLVQLGSIGDVVWDDVDGDGVQDVGEPGIPGVAVVLYDADGVEVARTMTAGDGSYLFADLPMGDYTAGFEGLPADTAFSPANSGGDDLLDSDADPVTGRTGTVTLTNDAPVRTDVDAGLQRTGSLGDVVWRDLDDDGVQDAGESGVADVTVVLYTSAGAEVARTTTGADGSYLFGDLVLGDYVVGFEAPDGLGFSPQDVGEDALDSDADPVTGRVAPVLLTREVPDVLTVDAGLVQLGSIGDRVWDDADGDGLQDDGEPGTPGVTVILYGGDGVEVARTTTAADGSYLFESLPMGDYAVGLEGLPADTAFSPAAQGADPALDSDVDPATGRTGTVTLSNEAPDRTDVDAGLFPVGSLGDTVWRDLDDDGVQDAGEPGLPGVAVVLYDATGAEAARTTTADDGSYVFGALPLGDYTVSFAAPDGFGLSPQDSGADDALDSDADPVSGSTGTVTLTREAPHRTDVDAGVVRLGSIGDTVWDDVDGDGVQNAGEPGLPGVTVVLYDAAGAEVARTTTTDDGTYLLTGLPMGDYTVGFEGLPADTAFSPSGQGGDPALDSDADPVTGRTATITLTNEVPDRTDVDAGLQRLGSIGDRVWRDLDGDGVQGDGEPGVAGVTVVLYDAAGDEVASTTTAEDGTYLFEDLVLADYSVGFDGLPDGTAFTRAAQGGDPALDSDADPATRGTSTVALTREAPDRTDLDAGLVQLGSIGDTVWVDLDGDGVRDDGEPGLAGVTVVLYDATGVEVARTTTAADGSYGFESLPMGDYTVGFEGLPADTAFSPAAQGGDPALDSDVDPATGRTATVTLTNDVPDRTDVDAGLQPTGSIGDTVWRDLDDDGVQDAGEPGLAGVVVVLDDATGAEAARTTTAEDGSYVFDDLELGEYVVGFEGLPTGLAWAPVAQADDPALDSDADPATGRTGAVTLTNEAPDRTDVDAGVVQLGSIGDAVWSDLDGDGTQDAGEPGVPGVTVVLYDAAGVEVGRTTTADDGSYVFSGQPMGDYTVGFEGLPADTAFSPSGQGDDPALDSDANPATGRTATSSLTNEAPDRTDVDAGLQPTGAIGDLVWRDLDDDGVQDDGEPGLAGVTVVLYDAAGAEVARTITTADGSYLFDDLVLGEYTVGTEVPDGLGFAPLDAGDDATDSDADPVTGRTAAVVLTLDLPEVLTVDVGLVQLGTIGDRVWSDVDGDGVQDDGEAGTPGITVVLYDVDGIEVARATTAADGSYLFTGLPMGDYTVGFEGLPAGTVFSPSGQGGDPVLDSDADPATGRTGTITLTNEAPDSAGADAGLVRLGSVGNRVWDDVDGDGVQDDGEPGLAGVTVVLYDGTGTETTRMTTGTDGGYLFDGLLLGDYTVAFSGLPLWMAFSPSVQGGDAALDSDVDPGTGRTATITLSDDVPDRTDVDAGVQPVGAIGDTVWLDADGDGVQDTGEPGVAGVVVTLYDESGAEVARTTTGADGSYLFEDVPLGTYTAGFSGLPSGARFTSPGAGGDTGADSDVDPGSGRTGPVVLTRDAPERLDVDAGLVRPVAGPPDRRDPTPVPRRPATALPVTGAEIGATIGAVVLLVVVGSVLLGMRRRGQSG